ncbi:MAG: hypothetical protein E6H94_00005, partial [Chloroflexi bacterium]
AAFLFFCSILAHELAHAVVARRFRMSVSSITLFLLGGVANLTKEPPSARAEFFMAAAGPATSVVIGLAGLGLEAFTDANLDQFPTLQPVGAVAGYLGFINAFVLAARRSPDCSSSARCGGSSPETAAACGGASSRTSSTTPRPRRSSRSASPASSGPSASASS